MNHIFVLTGTAALLFAEQNGHYTPLIPQQPDSEDETAEAPTDYYDIIYQFQHRERRFGKTSEQIKSVTKQ